MAQVNMSLRIDAELKDAFMAAAKSMDRNGSQLIRDFMRQTVERQHNTWFRDQVAAGRQQLERGDVIRIEGRAISNSEFLAQRIVVETSVRER